MILEMCSVCHGTCETEGIDCWFCEGSGLQPTCIICDGLIEPDNPAGQNELCRFHAAEAGAEAGEMI